MMALFIVGLIIGCGLALFVDMRARARVARLEALLAKTFDGIFQNG